MGIFDWLLNFALKVFAVPGLHAILTAVAVGFALTYLMSRSLPANMAVCTAIRYQRLIVFITVFSISFSMVPSPVMGAWAFTVAIFTPQFYDWVTEIIFHRWPWLKPKALMTFDEYQKSQR